MGLRGVLRHPGTLAGGFLALATLSVMNSAYSTVLDSIKGDLALSYTESGALMSTYFIGYALGQIPWGVLADRKGSRPTITLSVLGVSAATVFFGFSDDIVYALASRFITGLLGAGIFVPSVRLVSAWFNADERGTALGVLNIGGSLGLVVASWAVPLVSVGLGWRMTIGSTGAFGLLSAAVVWFLLNDRNENHYGSIHLASLPLNDRSFWYLAASQFIRLGSYYTFIAWLPLVLKEDYGLSLVATSRALSIFNLAGMLANPLGGVVSDRIGEKKVLIASFALLSLILLVFTGTLSGVTVYGVVFVLGWFINFIRSPAFTIIPGIYGTEAAGSISGIHNTFASFGALVLPFTLGFIKDFTLSYSAGWLTVSMLMMLGAGLVYSLKKTISEKITPI
ncbi:MAG: MFS transporter [Candidatus Bathyarchaeota archaeon]|nr:MFS transporter [Candidatus Bathyarchaeota archaeon]